MCYNLIKVKERITKEWCKGKKVMLVRVILEDGEVEVVEVDERFSYYFTVDEDDWTLEQELTVDELEDEVWLAVSASFRSMMDLLDYTYELVE